MNVRLLMGGVALVFGLAVAPAAAQERLVHQEVDRNTSAVIRVFKTVEGGRIELVTPALKVTKSISGNRVVTRMTEGREQLVISMDRDTVAVSTGAATVTAARSDRTRLERERQLIAASGVGRHAAALIGRLGLGSATPIQPLLLTTRAFILAAAGNGDGGRALAQWARQAALVASARPVALKVAWADPEQEKSSSSSPTDCWNAYSKEAIAAYIEYEECMKPLSWWEFLDEAACATVYDMRAVGAFSWWMKCVALN
jgi:hypothetical protein